MHRTCFLMGHRDTPESVFPLLKEAVFFLAREKDVSEFIVGNRGAFDRMAARAVCALKESTPAVRLTLLLHQHPFFQDQSLPPGFDGSFYPNLPENLPPRFAMVQANHCAVDAADYLITFAKYPGGNALKLLEYARRRQIPALNLAETAAFELLFPNAAY